MSLTIKLVLVCWMSTLYCESRPADEPKKHDPIDVHDTDDEFEIKKPESTDQKYTEFIDELYKHDTNKKPSKTKRDLSKVSEASIHAELKSLDITEQLAYENILDNDDVNRGRRMIIFRYFKG